MKRTGKGIWVASARDEDGYYVPMVAAVDRAVMIKAYDDWAQGQSNNKYWQLDVAPMETFVPIYKEGE